MWDLRVNVLFHQLVRLCTPLQLYLCCHIILPPHLCYAHKPKSISIIWSNIISFILLVIVNQFHIYHIWSYSCYIVVILTFAVDLETRFCSNIFIHELRLTYASKSKFSEHNRTESCPPLGREGRGLIPRWLKLLSWHFFMNSSTS